MKFSNITSPPLDPRPLIPPSRKTHILTNPKRCLFSNFFYFLFISIFSMDPNEKLCKISFKKFFWLLKNYKIAFLHFSRVSKRGPIKKKNLKLFLYVLKPR